MYKNKEGLSGYHHMKSRNIIVKVQLSKSKIFISIELFQWLIIRFKQNEKLFVWRNILFISEKDVFLIITADGIMSLDDVVKNPTRSTVWRDARSGMIQVCYIRQCESDTKVSSERPNKNQNDTLFVFKRIQWSTRDIYQIARLYMDECYAIISSFCSLQSLLRCRLTELRESI